MRTGEVEYFAASVVPSNGSVVVRPRFVLVEDPLELSSARRGQEGGLRVAVECRRVESDKQQKLQLL